MDAFDILLVSTADWDNPFWTNKQHVAVELARRGHRILYVESAGTRRPSATSRDLSRIWRRLRSGLKPPRRVQERIWVWSPLVIPWQSKAAVRTLNKALISIQLAIVQAVIGFSPKVLWTYAPLTTCFYDLGRFKLTIYHSVDDIKEQPGMPREIIATADQDLARRADIIFTTAPHLNAVNKALNPSTYYFPNVADFAHFNSAMGEGPIPADLEAIPGPRIGFVGAISGYKQDLELIRRVAEARPGYSFVLIGEIGEGDPWTDPSILSGAPNLHLIGPRPYGALPAYLRGMDVAILPSRLNDYTRSMFPMKFFEYLAAGLPVVSTRIPAIADYADLALLRDPETFAEGVDAAVAGDCAPLEARLAAARDQTYEVRTGKMLDLIRALPQRSA